MMINQDELGSRIETYDRWRFVTTNGKYPTHAIARDENGDWVIWDIGIIPWKIIVLYATLDEAIGSISNRCEYHQIRTVSQYDE